MTREQKISELATKLGIVNHKVGGLYEGDLTIDHLNFYDADDRLVETVTGTPMNKAGRLFFQQFSNQGIALLPLHELLLAEAQAFFAEVWTEYPNPAQKLLYALRTCDHVRIVLK